MISWWFLQCQIQMYFCEQKCAKWLEKWNQKCVKCPINRDPGADAFPRLQIGHSTEKVHHQINREQIQITLKTFIYKTAAPSHFTFRLALLRNECRRQNFFCFLRQISFQRGCSGETAKRERDKVNGPQLFPFCKTVENVHIVHSV